MSEFLYVQEAVALQEQVERERADKAGLKRKLDAAASRVSVLEKEVMRMLLKFYA